MPRTITKIFAFALSFLLIFEQSGFAQVAGQLDISSHFMQLRASFVQDKFRPLHLRYISYDNLKNSFKILLDKGDLSKRVSSHETRGLSPQGSVPEGEVTEETRKLLNYFFIGISLPNDSFWVNLRPDSPDNMIDDYLAETDVGKILLEADLQLKKDTAQFTSPQTPEGKDYWDKLYKKAEELLGYDNITIPTLTRPWIVPDEIIIRETPENAYVYKATLKVMLEQDYLKDSATYNFNDTRLKKLNEYSSQLIRETIIPKLTKEINSAKRYAPLRQVYYSLILAQWFKARYYGKGGLYSWLIDRRKLDGLTSKESWSKNTYFQAYQKSFKDGEYNIKEPMSTPMGQTVRSYFSGGMNFQIEGMPPKGSSPLGPGEKIISQDNRFTIIGSNPLRTSFTLNMPVAAIQGGKISDLSPSAVTIENSWGKESPSLALPPQRTTAEIPESSVGSPLQTPTASPSLISMVKNKILSALLPVFMSITLLSPFLFHVRDSNADLLMVYEGSRNIPELAKKASEGDRIFVLDLYFLAREEGNKPAMEALRTLNPQACAKKAGQGDKESVLALERLSEYGNAAALKALIRLASVSNDEVLVSRAVIVLRDAHVRINNPMDERELKNLLSISEFSDQALSKFIMNEEMFGDMFKLLFGELKQRLHNSGQGFSGLLNNKLNGKDAIRFLKQLAIFTDVGEAAKEFPDLAEGIAQVIFRDRNDIIFNASRVESIIQRLLKPGGVFEQKLIEFYSSLKPGDQRTDVLKAVFSLNKDLFTNKAQEILRGLGAFSAVDIAGFQSIPYDRLIKDGILDATIYFYQPEWFDWNANILSNQLGYNSSAREEGRVTLSKTVNGVNIKLNLILSGKAKNTETRSPMVFHRGHSYQTKNTINQLSAENTALFMVLGCRGLEYVDDTIVKKGLLIPFSGTLGTGQGEINNIIVPAALMALAELSTRENASWGDYYEKFERNAKVIMGKLRVKDEVDFKKYMFLPDDKEILLPAILKTFATPNNSSSPVSLAKAIIGKAAPLIVALSLLMANVGEAFQGVFETFTPGGVIRGDIIIDDKDIDFSSVVKDLTGAMNVSLSPEQISKLATRLKNNNPQAISLSNPPGLIPGKVVDISGTLANISAEEILRRARHISTFEVEVGGQKVKVHFLDGALSKTFRSVFALNCKDDILINIRQIIEEAKNIQKVILLPNAENEYLREEFNGLSVDQITVMMAKESLYHELIHTYILEQVRAGDYKDKEFMSRVDVQLAAGGKFNLRHASMVKEEILAYLAEMAISENPRRMLAGLASFTKEDPSSVYTQAAKIILTEIFSDMPQFAEYMIKERYDFIRGISGRALKEKAKEKFEQLFGKLPDYEFFIPNAVPLFKELQKNPLLQDESGSSPIKDISSFNAVDWLGENFVKKLAKRFGAKEAEFVTMAIDVEKQSLSAGIYRGLEGVDDRKFVFLNLNIVSEEKVEHVLVADVAGNLKDGFNGISHYLIGNDNDHGEILDKFQFVMVVDNFIKNNGPVYLKAISLGKFDFARYFFHWKGIRASEAFENIQGVLKSHYAGKKIVALALHPAVENWLKKYFNAKLVAKDRPGPERDFIDEYLKISRISEKSNLFLGEVSASLPLEKNSVAPTLSIIAIARKIYSWFKSSPSREDVVKGVTDICNGALIEKFGYLPKLVSTDEGNFAFADIGTIVKAMDKISVKEGMRFVELGSGDGRVSLTMAGIFGVKANGIERNREIYDVSENNLAKSKEQGLLGKGDVSFKNDDIFNDRETLRDADIVFYYLGSGAGTEKVLNKILTENKKPDVRVVFYGFESSLSIVPGWDEIIDKQGHAWGRVLKKASSAPLKEDGKKPAGSPMQNKAGRSSSAVRTEASKGIQNEFMGVVNAALDRVNAKLKERFGEDFVYSALHPGGSYSLGLVIPNSDLDGMTLFFNTITTEEKKWVIAMVKAELEAISIDVQESSLAVYSMQEIKELQEYLSGAKSNPSEENLDKDAEVYYALQGLHYYVSIFGNPEQLRKDFPLTASLAGQMSGDLKTQIETPSDKTEEHFGWPYNPKKMARVRYLTLLTSLDSKTKAELEAVTLGKSKEYLISNKLFKILLENHLVAKSPDNDYILLYLGSNKKRKITVEGRAEEDWRVSRLFLSPAGGLLASLTALLVVENWKDIIRKYQARYAISLLKKEKALAKNVEFGVGDLCLKVTVRQGYAFELGHGVLRIKDRSGNFIASLQNDKHGKSKLYWEYVARLMRISARYFLSAQEQETFEKLSRELSSMEEDTREFKFGREDLLWNLLHGLRVNEAGNKKVGLGSRLIQDLLETYDGYAYKAAIERLPLIGRDGKNNESKDIASVIMYLNANPDLARKGLSIQEKGFLNSNINALMEVAVRAIDPGLADPAKYALRLLARPDTLTLFLELYRKDPSLANAIMLNEIILSFQKSGWSAEQISGKYSVFTSLVFERIKSEKCLNLSELIPSLAHLYDRGLNKNDALYMLLNLLENGYIETTPHVDKVAAVLLEGLNDKDKFYMWEIIVRDLLKDSLLMSRGKVMRVGLGGSDSAEMINDGTSGINPFLANNKVQDYFKGIIFATSQAPTVNNVSMLDLVLGTLSGNEKSTVALLGVGQESVDGLFTGLSIPVVGELQNKERLCKMIAFVLASKDAKTTVSPDQFREFLKLLATGKGSPALYGAMSTAISSNDGLFKVLLDDLALGMKSGDRLLVNGLVEFLSRPGLKRTLTEEDLGVILSAGKFAGLNGDAAERFASVIKAVLLQHNKNLLPMLFSDDLAKKVFPNLADPSLKSVAENEAIAKDVKAFIWEEMAFSPRQWAGGFLILGILIEHKVASFLQAVPFIVEKMEKGGDLETSVSALEYIMKRYYPRNWDAKELMEFKYHLKNNTDLYLKGEARQKEEEMLSDALQVILNLGKSKVEPVEIARYLLSKKDAFSLRELAAADLRELNAFGENMPKIAAIINKTSKVNLKISLLKELIRTGKIILRMGSVFKNTSTEEINRLKAISYQQYIVQELDNQYSAMTTRLNDISLSKGADIQDVSDVVQGIFEGYRSIASELGKKEIEEIDKDLQPIQKKIKYITDIKPLKGLKGLLEFPLIENIRAQMSLKKDARNIEDLVKVLKDKSDDFRAGALKDYVVGIRRGLLQDIIGEDLPAGYEISADMDNVIVGYYSSQHLPQLKVDIINTLKAYIFKGAKEANLERFQYAKEFLRSWGYDTAPLLDGVEYRINSERMNEEEFEGRKKDKIREQVEEAKAHLIDIGVSQNLAGDILEKVSSNDLLDLKEDGTIALLNEAAKEFPAPVSKKWNVYLAMDIAQHIIEAQGINMRKRQASKPKEWVFYLSIDPVEMMNMGVDMGGSCLSLLNGGNTHSAFINAVDGLKAVVFARDSVTNRRIGRRLLVLTPEGTLVHKEYNPDVNNNLGDGWAGLFKLISQKTKKPVIIPEPNAIDSNLSKAITNIPTVQKEGLTIIAPGKHVGIFYDDLHLGAEDIEKGIITYSIPQASLILPEVGVMTNAKHEGSEGLAGSPIDSAKGVASSTLKDDSKEKTSRQEALNYFYANKGTLWNSMSDAAFQNYIKENHPLLELKDGQLVAKGVIPRSEDKRKEENIRAGIFKDVQGMSGVFYLTGLKNLEGVDNLLMEQGFAAPGQNKEQSKLAKDLDRLLDAVLSIADKNNIMAHGVSGRRSPEGGIDVLLSILLDGKIQPSKYDKELSLAYFGKLDTETDNNEKPAYYGPFYILLGDEYNFSSNIEDADDVLAHITDEDQSHQLYKGIPAKDHRLYLVPTDADADYLKKGLDLAVERGVMDQEEAGKAKLKIITYAQFVKRFSGAKGKSRLRQVVAPSSISEQERIDKALNKYKGKIIALGELVKEIGLNNDVVVARINKINSDESLPWQIEHVGGGEISIKLKKTSSPLMGRDFYRSRIHDASNLSNFLLKLDDSSDSWAGGYLNEYDKFMRLALDSSSEEEVLREQARIVLTELKALSGKGNDRVQEIVNILTAIFSEAPEEESFGLKDSLSWFKEFYYWSVSGASRVALEIKGAEEGQNVFASKYLLYLLFKNIASNAGNAGAKNMAITIHNEAGEYIINAVDDGPGISEAIKDNLFDAGVTSAKNTEGRGFGLWIARDIVERILGGNISASNNPGGGAVITIKLPMAASSALENKIRNNLYGNVLQEKYVHYFNALNGILAKGSLESPVVAYGASGADVSTLWLATHFAKAYFIDKVMVAKEDLQEALSEWDTDTFSFDYFKNKRTNGYAYESNINNGGVALWVMQELKNMGAGKDDIRISEDSNGRAELYFRLSKDDMERRIIFVAQELQALSSNTELSNELLSGVDVYYQKASLDLVVQQDFYLDVVGKWLKPGGFLMINNVTSSDFRIDIRSRLNGGFEKITNQAVEEEEGRIGQDLFRSAGYGWRMEVFQKNFAPSLLRIQRQTDYRDFGAYAGLLRDIPLETWDLLGLMKDLAEHKPDKGVYVDVGSGVNGALGWVSFYYGDKIDLHGINKDGRMVLSNEEIEQIYAGQPEGIEKHKEIYRLGEKVGVIKGDINDDATVIPPADLITSFFTLQYTKDPLGAWVKMFNSLKPGGKVVAHLLIPIDRNDLRVFYLNFMDKLKESGIIASFGERMNHDNGTLNIFLLAEKTGSQEIKLNAKPVKIEPAQIIQADEKEFEIQVVSYGDIDLKVTTGSPVAQEASSSVRKNEILPEAVFGEQLNYAQRKQIAKAREQLDNKFGKWSDKLARKEAIKLVAETQKMVASILVGVSSRDLFDPEHITSILFYNQGAMAKLKTAVDESKDGVVKLNRFVPEALLHGEEYAEIKVRKDKLNKKFISEFVGSTERYYSLTRWDFLNRFPGAGGMILWRGVSELEKDSHFNYRPGDKINIDSKYFTFFPRYAVEFIDYDEDLPLLVAYIPYSSLRMTSWLTNVKEGVLNEPEVLVSGAAYFTDLIFLDSEADDLGTKLSIYEAGMDEILKKLGKIDLQYFKKNDGGQGELSAANEFVLKLNRFIGDGKLSNPVYRENAVSGLKDMLLGTFKINDAGEKDLIQKIFLNQITSPQLPGQLMEYHNNYGQRLGVLKDFVSAKGNILKATGFKDLGNEEKQSVNEFFERLEMLVRGEIFSVSVEDAPISPVDLDFYRSRIHDAGNLSNWLLALGDSSDSWADGYLNEYKKFKRLALDSSSEEEVLIKQAGIVLKELKALSGKGNDRVQEIVKILTAIFSEAPEEESVGLKDSLSWFKEFYYWSVSGASRVELEINGAKEGQNVFASKYLLYLLFKNIASNAGNAGAKNMAITIHSEAGEYIIDAADDGPGIPEEIKDNLFDAGVTSAKNTDGRGFELWIARDIVKRILGGRISASNNPGGGATITIKLPMAASSLETTISEILRDFIKDNIPTKAIKDIVWISKRYAELGAQWRKAAEEALKSSGYINDELVRRESIYFFKNRIYSYAGKKGDSSKEEMLVFEFTNKIKEKLYYDTEESNVSLCLGELSLKEAPISRVLITEQIDKNEIEQYLEKIGIRAPVKYFSETELQPYIGSNTIIPSEEMHYYHSVDKADIPGIFNDAFLFSQQAKSIDFPISKRISDNTFGLLKGVYHNGKTLANLIKENILSNENYFDLNSSEHIMNKDRDSMKKEVERLVLQIRGAEQKFASSKNESAINKIKASDSPVEMSNPIRDGIIYLAKVALSKAYQYKQANNPVDEKVMREIISNVVDELLSMGAQEREYLRTQEETFRSLADPWMVSAMKEKENKNNFIETILGYLKSEGLDNVMQDVAAFNKGKGIGQVIDVRINLTRPLVDKFYAEVLNRNETVKIGNSLLLQEPQAFQDLLEQFKGKAISFADLGSGPRGEFGKNLKKVLDSLGIRVADGISVDNGAVDQDALAGEVKRADVTHLADREAVGLKNNSFDLVFVNNMVNVDMVEPASNILKPGGTLIITFAESDIDGGDYANIINDSKEKILELSEKIPGYDFTVHGAFLPAGYPVANVQYGSHSKILIVNKSEKAFAGSPVEGKVSPSEVSDKGGIDFRGLPIVTQGQVGILGDSPLRGQSPLLDVAPVVMDKVKMDEAWSQMQNMLNAGIIPSSERIKEYLLSCCQGGDFGSEADKVLAVIADILRMEEDRSVSTEPELKDFLVLLESDKTPDAVQKELINITVAPKAPVLVE